jgi:hypothetical protein
MKLTPIPIEAVKVDSACLLSLTSEPANVRKIVWITSATLAAVVLQSVYLFACVSRPIAKLERTVAKHSTQIESIFSVLSESAQSQIAEQFRGK